VTERRTDKLLRDLFVLYSKYGRAEFEAAIKALESGSAIQMLLRVAASSAETFARIVPNEAERRSVTRKRATPKERLDQFIADLLARGDEDSVVVARFVADVAERKALRNAPILREYSRRLGIPLDGKMDRRVLAMKIGEVLLNEPRERRRVHMASGMQFGSEASSLEGWSKIIVKDQK
jgi:hypothetical protein